MGTEIIRSNGKSWVYLHHILKERRSQIYYHLDNPALSAIDKPSLSWPSILVISLGGLFIVFWIQSVGFTHYLITMSLSTKAANIYSRISQENTKLGDLRKIAKEVKKDHELALELWTTGNIMARQLAILIMDKKQVTKELIDQFDHDIQTHDIDDRNQLTDWFMANQLTRDKRTIAMMESWEHSSSVMKRRIFWYYQARLRWMGKTDHPNTEDLLTSIEANMADEQAEVQWAMNYTAGQIGKWQEEYRDRCIAIGEKTGLYKDEVVPRGCTPSYLPKFIPIEVAKLQK